MRDLKINQQLVCYRNYTGEVETQDNYGYYTGGRKPSYGEVKSGMFCVSPNTGTYDAEMFGNLQDYDRTMTAADITTDIDENTILWVNTSDTTKPYDHIVKKKAIWKNSVLFALKEVKVDYAETSPDITE